jgi:hypothetical protein
MIVVAIVSLIALVVGFSAAFGYCRYLSIQYRRRRAVMDKPPRKRVVVMMHSNSLYQSTGKDSGSGITPLLPLVKIEGGDRLPNGALVSVSDYEIPLDKDWEFPRDK